MMKFRKEYKNYKNMFTLIIQGSLSNMTQKIVNSALSENRIEKIIVSHWNIDPIKIELNNKVEVVVSNNPYVNNTSDIAWNKFNLANQSFTTKIAFSKNITTQYVIKLRSDWPYLDFKKLIDTFLEDPEKILTSNLFFRPTEKHPFHCSDHLIVSTREVIQKAFENVYQRCLDKDIARTYYASGYYNNISSPAVEQIICDELLYSKNVTERDEPSFIMKNNFRIIIAEELTNGETLPVSSHDANRSFPIVMNIEEL